MKIFIKKYFFIIAIAIGWIFSGCSAGNKVIPDLFDITRIDTSNNILSLFKVYATGDTSFTMNVTSLDSLSQEFKNSISNDSITLVGLEMNLLTPTGNGFYFKTYGNTVGTYNLDTLNGNIKNAEFIFLKTTGGVLYTMKNGYIQITEINTTDKTIKGNFDVNNFIKTTTTKGFRMKAYFYAKYV